MCFEEPWCSSSKGRPIYVLSNAKPNELLIEAEFFASIYKSTYTYSCPTPAPPSGCTYHPHSYIHAAAAPSQLPSCPSQGPHTPAAPPMLMGWVALLQVLDHLGRMQSSIYTCTKAEMPKDLICLRG